MAAAARAFTAAERRSQRPPRQVSQTSSVARTTGVSARTTSMYIPMHPATHSSVSARGTSSDRRQAARAIASRPTWSPEIERMWTVPVTRKSSASSRGNDSRLPSRSAAASGAREGDRCACRASAPRRRMPSTKAGGHHHGGSHVTRTHAGAPTRTIDRHRFVRARKRKSNSPGFSAEAGRKPRPSTVSRAPTRRAGGGPSTTTAARPDAGSHRPPFRTACTATTHSLDGPRATAWAAMPAGGGRGRGDSSTVQRIATGCGSSARLQARSSARKRSCCAAAHAPPAHATAAQSHATLLPARGHDTPQPTSAPAAAPHQATAPPRPNAGASRAAAQPPARQMATTTNGRQGSGSLRQARRSRHAAALHNAATRDAACGQMPQSRPRISSMPSSPCSHDGTRTRQVLSERGGHEGQKNAPPPHFHCHPSPQAQAGR